jgi:hypothetical protein
MKHGLKTNLFFVAPRRGKLASYEVAGAGGQNEFVPRGTME